MTNGATPKNEEKPKETKPKAGQEEKKGEK